MSFLEVNPSRRLASWVGRFLGQYLEDFDDDVLQVCVTKDEVTVYCCVVRVLCSGLRANFAAKVEVSRAQS